MPRKAYNMRVHEFRRHTQWVHVLASLLHSLGAWHVVHVHRAVDSEGIAELHLLLLQWYRRDASMCPSSKRLLSVPVAPLACHTVARTEVRGNMVHMYIYKSPAVPTDAIFTINIETNGIKCCC